MEHIERKTSEAAPVDWDQRYRDGDTPWDKGGPAPELAFALGEGMLKGRVLVPGCGRGHDVRAIAAAGTGEVVGLDLAAEAISAARAAGVPENAFFMEGDLFQAPGIVEGRFEWVWEHTCFCAISPADRGRYVEAIRSLLQPDGKLLALFFLDPGLEDPLAGPPFGTNRGELDAYFSSAFALEGEWLPRATYPGREGREIVRLLRRL